jgi:hypothetical protein
VTVLAAVLLLTSLVGLVVMVPLVLESTAPDDSTQDHPYRVRSHRAGRRAAHAW